MNFLEAFVPQLLATLVGAGIGVFGVWWAFHLQPRVTTHDDVERAVENVLMRISEHIEAIVAFNADYNLMRWDPKDKLHRTAPHAARVSIAIDVLRIRTSGDEREMAGRR